MLISKKENHGMGIREGRRNNTLKIWDNVNI